MNMEPQGLAQATQAGQQQISVQEIVELLLQGANPEDLLKQGVPLELIKEAIKIIMAQDQQAQAPSPVPATEAGLAATQSPY